jgi:hypothetical protein
MYLVSEKYPSSMSHILLGPTSYLGGNIRVSNSRSFLESPVNLSMRDLHHHAVWMQYLFVLRGEITLMHCVWGD